MLEHVIKRLRGSVERMSRTVRYLTSERLVHYGPKASSLPATPASISMYTRARGEMVEGSVLPDHCCIALDEGDVVKASQDTDVVRFKDNSSRLDRKFVTKLKAGDEMTLVRPVHMRITDRAVPVAPGAPVDHYVVSVKGMDGLYNIHSRALHGGTLARKGKGRV